MQLEDNGWTTCTCDAGGSAGCPVHDAAADDGVPVNDGDGHKKWDYDCLMLHEGKLVVETIVGVSTGHAFEEAGYVCEGKCLAVRRGQYLYD